MRFFKKKPQEVKNSQTGTLISYSKVGQPVWSGRNYESFAEEGYVRNVIAYRCISMVAQAVGSMSWQLFDANGQQVEKSPLLDLLDKPNSMQSGSDLFESIVSYYMISGNAYVEAAYSGNSLAPSKKPPVYLYSLRPDRMTIIAGTKGTPGGYKYEVGGVSKTFQVSTTGISNILHVRSFNPINDWYGLADTQAGAYSIDQHNESQKWNQALLQNSAVPSSVLIAEGNLEQEEYDLLKTMVEDRYSGPTNAGKPLLLEGKMDWKSLGLSPREMDWIEGKREAARDIALSYGVPPMLLGIPGDNTYNNQREALLALWEYTIIPIAQKILNCLNYWLAPRYGEGLYLAYDKEKISALGLRREMQRDSLEKASFLTINEKRAAMGLEPVQGGDELLVDSNKIPLGFANEPVIKSAEESYVMSLKDIGFSVAEIKEILMQESVNLCDAEKTQDIDKLLGLLENGN